MTTSFNTATKELAAGKQNQVYLIKESDLFKNDDSLSFSFLKSFSDMGSISVVDSGGGKISSSTTPVKLDVLTMSVDNGELIDNNDGTWIFTPDTDYLGQVTLNYVVESNTSDYEAEGIQTFKIEPIQSTNTTETNTMSTSYKTIDYLPDLSSSQMAVAAAVSFLPVGKATSWNYADAPTYSDLALILSQKDGNPSEWDNVAQYATTSKVSNSLVSFQGIAGATYDFANISGSGQAFQVYDNLGNVIAIAGSGISSSSFFSTKDYHYAGYFLSNFSAPYTGTYYMDANWNQSYSQFVGLIIYENSDTAPKPNQLPSGSVTVSGEVQQGKILTASNSLTDLDGLGTISYQWLNSGMPISGANQSNYTLTANDVGKAISVKASYTDLQGTAESVTSNPTALISAPVAPVNHAPTGNVSVNGTPKENQTLWASNTITDADNLGIVTYQWLSDGTPVSNANQTIYNLTKSDIGKAISVSASYTDGLGKLENVTSTMVKIANVNDLPTGSVNITGDSQQGKTLTATNSLVDLDGLGSIKYQWLQNDLPIKNANQTTYTLTKNDIGKSISVKASYTDIFGTAESMNSQPTTVVQKLVVVPITNTKPTNGNDVLTGTASNDTLNGGLGFDQLTGGAGTDKFVYKSIKDAPVSHSKIEVITDFSSNDKDKIDLAGIDADTSQAKDQAFSKPVMGAEFSGVFTKAGQLFFDTTDHILYGSVNNDGAASFAIQLNGVSSLVAGDFVL